MQTKNLVEAIINGDSVQIQSTFESVIANKIDSKLSEMKKCVAKNMFKSVDEQIDEVLSKDDSAGDWIRDFISSDDPKFAGKSKEKRKQMALAAYYAKQREK